MTDPKPPTGTDSSEPVEAPSAAAPSEPAAAPSEPAAAPLGEAPSDESARRKKRKKKKKAAEATAPGPERPELDARGRERPKFLLRFPEDPELDALIAAFEAGNYFEVRQQGPRLVASTTRPEVKAAAEELLRRIEPDPLIKFFLAVAVALFVAIVAYVYFIHD